MANKQHLTANYMNEDKNHKYFAEKLVLYTNKNMHEKERKNMEIIFEIVWYITQFITQIIIIIILMKTWYSASPRKALSALQLW